MAQLISRKLHQTTQYAFSSIREVGQTEFQRKHQLVEKYLTRRARNNFLAFRSATQSETIGIWRSKFTDTVKASVLLDAVAGIVRKTKADTWGILSAYHHFTYKTNSLITTLSEYQSSITRSVFRAVRYEGQRQLLDTARTVVEQVRQKRLLEGFQRLNSHRKINRMVNTLKKVEERRAKTEDLIKIRARK